jgi:hypothetical protein
MKMPLNPNPLEARQPGSGVAPTQGAQGATGVCATAGDRRDLDISPPDPEVTEAKPRRRFTAAASEDSVFPRPACANICRRERSTQRHQAIIEITPVRSQRLIMSWFINDTGHGE